MAAGLGWLARSVPAARWILKADSDTLVNLPLLTTFLRHYGEPNAVYGHLHANSWVQRKGRWAVSRQRLPIPKYPIYAAGNAYVMARDAALNITAMAGRFPYVPVEDAFLTGILASVCRVTRISLAGFPFWYENRPPNCDFRLDKRFAGTGYTPQSLREAWTELLAHPGPRGC